MRTLRTLWASSLALICCAAPPARAQFVVIDPANLAQSILQVTHMVEQISNQVRQVEQAAAMLASSPLDLSSELSRAIYDTRALFSAVEGLAFEAERLAQDLRTLYPENWDNAGLDEALGRSDRWLAESKSALERAMRAEARALEAIAQNTDRMQRALSASASAEGQTGAIQAGNQLQGAQLAQLAELTALIAAQGRALETERLERIAREQRARAIQRRAFPSQRQDRPAPARSAFE